jgi:hypothetical protein
MVPRKKMRKEIDGTSRVFDVPYSLGSSPDDLELVAQIYFSKGNIVVNEHARHILKTLGDKFYARITGAYDDKLEEKKLKLTDHACIRVIVKGYHDARPSSFPNKELARCRARLTAEMAGKMFIQACQGAYDPLPPRAVKRIVTQNAKKIKPKWEDIKNELGKDWINKPTKSKKWVLFYASSSPLLNPYQRPTPREGKFENSNRRADVFARVHLITRERGKQPSQKGFWEVPTQFLEIVSTIGGYGGGGYRKTIYILEKKTWVHKSINVPEDQHVITAWNHRSSEDRYGKTRITRWRVAWSENKASIVALKRLVKVLTWIVKLKKGKMWDIPPGIPPGLADSDSKHEVFYWKWEHFERQVQNLKGQGKDNWKEYDEYLKYRSK